MLSTKANKGDRRVKCGSKKRVRPNDSEAEDEENNIT